MSVTALEQAFAIRAPTPTGKLVLLALAHAAGEDGSARATQLELADVTGLSERAVRDAQAALENAGLLRRARGGCVLQLEAASETNRQEPPVADPADRQEPPVEPAADERDRQLAPVHLDAEMLRAAVVREVGEAAAKSLFDTGQLDGGVLYARSLVAASKLRSLRSLAELEVRVGPKPAGAAGSA